MFGIGILEWIGYLASALVLISLLMSSIIKLRWINLTGSLVFAVYGFCIGALPVGISNLIIMCINIYYLVKIYSGKDYFRILPVSGSLEYLVDFLSFYKNEIAKFFPEREYKVDDDTVGFFVLRNMVPAGIFLAKKVGEDTLIIELDFVIPEYRDFKIGKYLYKEQRNYFLQRGYNKFTSFAMNKKHAAYLLKMGFQKTVSQEKEVFIKGI